jgi:hypothetical protein
MIGWLKGECLKIDIIRNKLTLSLQKRGINIENISYSLDNIKERDHTEGDFMTLRIVKKYDVIIDTNFISLRPDISLEDYFKKIKSTLKSKGRLLLKIYSEYAVTDTHHFCHNTFRKKDVLHKFVTIFELDLALKNNFSRHKIIEHKKNIKGRSKPFIYEAVAWD